MASCAVTGTATTAPFREGNVVTGGFTIILTLTGDTWVASGATFNAQRQAIINGMVSAQSETHGWNAEVTAKIAVTDVVRTSNTVVTITLDAEAAYNITALETVTITVPASALSGGIALVASPTIQVIPAPWTFYVRASMGADTNAGTTAATAWATVGKALGAAGISSGDTVYVGSGTYRENVNVTMVSPSATTYIIGDVDGAQTGDIGPVVITDYVSNDFTASGGATISFGGKANLTFRKLFFVVGSTIIGSSGAGTQHHVFEDCVFYSIGNNNPLSFTVTVDQTLDWTFDRCVFRHPGGGQWGSLTAPTTTNADYDINVLFRNCHIESGGIFIGLSGSGANSGKPYGVRFVNCSAFARIMSNGAGHSTTNASTCYNSYGCSWGSASLVANTLGMIVEDYNILNTRTNITAGTHSDGVGGGIPAPLIDLNSGPASVGRRLRYWVEPYDATSPLLGWGGTSVPSVDLLGRPRPCGTMTLGDSGTATAGAAKTLTNTNKTWGVNRFSGWQVKITGGTGSGQVKQIATNTNTVLTVDGNWITNPNNTSTYVIYAGAPATSGTATAGAATTMTDGNATWGTNQWTGYTLAIVAGTGSGQTTTVSSNTATVLTVPTWGTNPDNTSQYKLYRQTDENTVNAACGCLERGNTMTKDTTTVRTGSNSLRAFGPAIQDFEIPVDAVPTTITVWTRYDSTYAGTLPQVKVINGGECGVNDATATAVGAANAWEQLTLSFTPTRAGIVTIRLQSNCTATLGSAYFDDVEATPRATPNSFDHYRRGEPVASMGSLLGLARVV